MAAGSQIEAERRLPMRLNLRTDEDLREFMRAIHSAFLRCVHPRQSGLLDMLYAKDVITESDNSSMSGKDVTTRKEQARKLFILLNKFPVKLFVSKVAPHLCEMFPHIIPRKFRVDTNTGSTCSKDGEENTVGEQRCLLHALVNRIRPATMADMLYQIGILTLNEYESITESARRKKDVWVNLMEKLQNPPSDKLGHLEKGITRLLRRYHVPVSQNLKEALSAGLSCTRSCREKPKIPPGVSAPQPAFISKVQLWLRNGHMSDAESEFRTPLSPLSLLSKAVRSSASQSDDAMSVAGTRSRTTASTNESVVDSESDGETDSQPDSPCGLLVSPPLPNIFEIVPKKRKAYESFEKGNQESPSAEKTLKLGDAKYQGEKPTMPKSAPQRFGQGEMRHSSNSAHSYVFAQRHLPSNSSTNLSRPKDTSAQLSGPNVSVQQLRHRDLSTPVSRSGKVSIEQRLPGTVSAQSYRQNSVSNNVHPFGEALIQTRMPSNVSNETLRPNKHTSIDQRASDGCFTSSNHSDIVVVHQFKQNALRYCKKHKCYHRKK